MNDEPKVEAKAEVKEDPAPVLQVVPIEDLDKIEKLLDVCLNTVDMPNLPAIKQACMDELVQINNDLAEAQGVALEAYKKESAEWQAKRDAKRKAEEKERLAAERKAADERRAKEGEPERDSWTPPRDTMAQPRDMAAEARGNMAQQRDPTAQPEHRRF